MSRNFIFNFKGISFDTDEGDGQNSGLAHFLNEKYGSKRIHITADTEENALHEAVDQISEMSGYSVLDADYELQIS